jgi:hypothetical protein
VFLLQHTLFLVNRSIFLNAILYIVEKPVIKRFLGPKSGFLGPENSPNNWFQYRNWLGGMLYVKFATFFGFDSMQPNRLHNISQALKAVQNL